jgi:hypothetical protein
MCSVHLAQDSTQTVLSAGHKHTLIGISYDQLLYLAALLGVMDDRK